MAAETPTTTSSSSNTLSGLGNLIKLLPTGTFFSYQLLNPILTNNGRCSTGNKYISTAFFAVCGLSCFFSTFTDSYKDKKGNIYHGIATFNGFWPTSSSSSDDSTVDFKSYRLRIGDFVHAFLSLMVFCVLSLLDTNTVHCFYPSFEYNGKTLMMALPPVIGSVAATVFSSFPMKRNGIGYSLITSSTSAANSNSTV